MFLLRVDDRVELRLLELSHARALYGVIDRNREYLRQWLPWVDGSRSSDDVARHIGENLERYGNREALAAGIWIDGEICGAISIHKIDRLNRLSSIGYWLAADRQGAGVMTRACRAMVQHAFEEFALHRVEIRCATGNHRSCAIPQRLGFSLEGTLRGAEWLYDHFVDLVIYSMLEPEWEGFRRSNSDQDQPA